MLCRRELVSDLFRKDKQAPSMASHSLLYWSHRQTPEVRLMLAAATSKHQCHTCTNIFESYRVSEFPPFCSLTCRDVTSCHMSRSCPKTRLATRRNRCLLNGAGSPRLDYRLARSSDFGRHERFWALTIFYQSSRFSGWYRVPLNCLRCLGDKSEGWPRGQRLMAFASLVWIVN